MLTQEELREIEYISEHPEKTSANDIFYKLYKLEQYCKEIESKKILAIANLDRLIKSL